MDADPNSPNFSHATFRLDQGSRNLFVDKQNGVAIIPLWSQGENTGVLVTIPRKSADALKAAQMIRELWEQGAQKGAKKQIVDECIAAFKRYEFEISSNLARQAL
jgi:hypothetical protein